jgi:hypothetical protein
MKKPTILFCCFATVLMTQCSSPEVRSALVPSAASTMASQSYAQTSPTARGHVTTQTLGNSTVMTRRLINRPLTNKDVGKVLEEVTVVSPSGTSMQERVIVRALPRLETKNLTKS